jgi:hypothetical protein
MTKATTIQLRLTYEQKGKIERRAAQQGMKVSEFLRLLGVEGSLPRHAQEATENGSQRGGGGAERPHNGKPDPRPVSSVQRPSGASKAPEPISSFPTEP